MTCEAIPKNKSISDHMLLEELASFSHGSWAQWMSYLFNKTSQGLDGSVTIPPELVARWKRQLNTDYKDLSEKEKTSDQVEAAKIMAIFIMAIFNRGGSR